MGVRQEAGEMDKRRRRDIIRESIDARPIASQRELVEELSARGVVVDQSTVSRDLREMGVVRLPGHDGGLVYGFPWELGGPPAGDDLRRGLREFVVGVEASGNLVVLRTAPGNAQALAAVMDRFRLDEVAGTVAGDDTIVVVVREGFEAKKVAKKFSEMSES